VDATQSVVGGIDVNKVRPDFMIGSGYKWLLCPYGVTFLYAAPHRYDDSSAAAVETLEIHGWDDPNTGRGRAMWGLPGGESSSGILDVASSREARRFDMGESGNWAVLPGAVKALEQLNEWTPSRISEYVSPLLTHAENNAKSRGWTFPSSRVEHMTGLRRASGQEWPNDLVERCWRNHNVHISVRGQSLRISPYLYNTHDDIDKLFEALDAEVVV